MAQRNVQARPTDTVEDVTTGTGTGPGAGLVCRLAWDDAFSEQDILAACAKIRIKMVADVNF
jgi:hypothetical protein